MTQFIEKTGRNEAEAIRLALEELKLERDDVSIEVVDRAKSGFMGFGSKPAKVRVSYEDQQPEKAEQVETVQENEEAKIPEKVTNKPEEKVIPVENEVKPEMKAEVTKPEEKEVTPMPSDSVTSLDVKEEDAVNAVKEDKTPQETEVASVETSTEKPEEKQVKSVSKPEKPKKEPRGKEKISLEDQEAITAEITRFLTGLMEHLHVEAKPTVSYEKDIVLVKMEGENLAALIGKRGETLDAIQQITGYVVNKACQKRVRIYLDAENYRAKREETLIKLAEKVAGEAVKHKRNVTLEAMNAYERHIIHEALTKNPLVYTYSTGSDPNRCTVIAYQTKKPQGNRQRRS